MEIKTEGIVIKRRRLGECDDLAVIFTREKGKVYAKAKSSRKSNSKLSCGLEIFSTGDFTLNRKRADTGIFTVTGAKPKSMRENIRKSLPKISSAYMAAEMIDRFMQPEDANLGAYELFKRLLSNLDSCKEGGEDGLECAFKLGLLDLAGFDIRKDEDFLNSHEADGKVRSLIAGFCLSDPDASLKYDSKTASEANDFINMYVMETAGCGMNSSKLKPGKRGKA